MGTKPANATVRFDGWEGTGSRTNHEPEDLPGEMILFPRGLGNRWGWRSGCNPQGLSRPWGFFIFQTLKNVLRFGLAALRHCGVSAMFGAVGYC